ncbi:hypothetical protein NU195Hw_g2034t1 [Hortaea werneckii]
MMLLSALVSLPLLTVRAAIYAAQVIEAGNAIEVCGQAEAETEPPYDAELARTLVCEAAVGIDVFSESSDAVSDLTLALAGLESLAGSSNSPGENLLCNDPPIMPLNEAGLDGPGIWTLICTPSNSATASTPTPTSGLGGNEGQGDQTESTLSQSATVPGTTLSATEASATSAASIESLTTSSTFTSPVPSGTSNSTMRSSNPTILTTTSAPSTELTSGVDPSSSETVSDNTIRSSEYFWTFIFFLDFYRLPRGAHYHQLQQSQSADFFTDEHLLLGCTGVSIIRDFPSKLGRWLAFVIPAAYILNLKGAGDFHEKHNIDADAEFGND